MDGWQEHVATWPVTLGTGEKATGPVMRRSGEDGWQYRAMTAEELEPFMETEGWRVPPPVIIP
jgi:hypothetical protein